MVPLAPPQIPFEQIGVGDRAVVCVLTRLARRGRRRQWKRRDRTAESDDAVNRFWSYGSNHSGSCSSPPENCA